VARGRPALPSEKKVQTPSRVKLPRWSWGPFGPPPNRSPKGACAGPRPGPGPLHPLTLGQTGRPTTPPTAPTAKPIGPSRGPQPSTGPVCCALPAARPASPLTFSQTIRSERSPPSAGPRRRTTGRQNRARQAETGRCGCFLRSRRPSISRPFTLSGFSGRFSHPGGEPRGV